MDVVLILVQGGSCNEGELTDWGCVGEELDIVSELGGAFKSRLGEDWVFGLLINEEVITPKKPWARAAIIVMLLCKSFLTLNVLKQEGKRKLCEGKEM